MSSWLDDKFCDTEGHNRALHNQRRIAAAQEMRQLSQILPSSATRKRRRLKAATTHSTSRLSTFRGKAFGAFIIAAGVALTYQANEISRDAGGTTVAEYLLHGANRFCGEITQATRTPLTPNGITNAQRCFR